THEHDGHCIRDALRRSGTAGRCRNENVDLESDQLGGERGETLDFPRSVSLLDNDILTVDVAELPKAFQKGSDPSPRFFTAARNERQIPYAQRLSFVLGHRRSRRDENAPTHRSDERSPVHHRRLPRRSRHQSKVIRRDAGTGFREATFLESSL